VNANLKFFKNFEETEIEYERKVFESERWTVMPARKVREKTQQWKVCGGHSESLARIQVSGCINGRRRLAVVARILVNENMG
jgi:hypothetical protein